MSDFPVLDSNCFYCRQPVGSTHDDDCVLVSRMVRVKVTMEIDIEVPNGWDAELINFARNKGSWCKSNIVDDLQKAISRSENKCLCKCINIEYIGEAGGPFASDGSAVHGKRQCR